MTATDPFLYLDCSTLLGCWALTNKGTYLEAAPVNPGRFKHQFKCRYDDGEGGLVIEMFDGETWLNSWHTEKKIRLFEGADSYNAADIITELLQALTSSHQLAAPDLVNMLAPRNT